MRQIYITLGESVDHTSWVSLPVWYYSAVQGHTQPTTACRQVLRPYHDERASFGGREPTERNRRGCLGCWDGMVGYGGSLAMLSTKPFCFSFYFFRMQKNKNTCLTLAHTVHLRVTPFAARFDMSNLPYFKKYTIPYMMCMVHSCTTPRLYMI